MKPPLIVASLAVLGLALVVAIITVNGTSATVEPVAQRTVVASQPGKNPEMPTPVVEISPMEKVAPAKPPFHWSQVESKDYREYIANLKSTGCSKPTINDIIIAELNALYEPRESPLRTQIAGFQVRQSPDPALEAGNTKQEFAIRRQLREVEQEKQAIIKELLGVEIPLDPIRGWHPRTYERYESALNTVPPEKRELVRQIQETYWETSDQLNDKYQLRRTPEYLEEYKKINADRQAQLAQVLSPETAADFEMRSSGIASRLGTYLSGSGVTPEEFREVFKVKNSVEAPYGGSVRVNMTEAGETPEHLQDKQAAENRIAEILGPERYASYQLAQDPGFQRFSDLSDRFGVVRENLIQAYRLQQQMAPVRQSSVGILQAGTAPSPEEQQKYQATMRQLLGEPAFNALQRGQNFSRLDQLFLP